MPADVAADLAAEVAELFVRHRIPEAGEGGQSAATCDRILMVSPHGYWGDPPPAGATDTGGQTFFVLQVSKEWARSGRKVVILARWFAPHPRVERLEDNLWLVRVRAGGDGFVRKEEIHPLAPQLAEAATAVAERFGARAVMGHYADGMVVAAEVAARLALPFLAMPHSLALTKIGGLGLDAGEPGTWLEEQYRFAAREACELAALAQADCVVGCLPDQLEVLSSVYGLRGRRDIVAPGVAPVFFEAAAKPPDPAVPARLGLVPGRYLIVTSRLAETKNIPGAVAVLGEARALARGRLDPVCLAVVGGTREPHQPEELAVEAGIEAAMDRYRLTDRDVVRIPAQPWPVLAQLLRQSLFYIGMQQFEPFGMGAAEALAVGAPVMLSRRAGIARVLEATQGAGDPGCALLVDPADPRRAARRMVDALDSRAQLDRMTRAGRDLAGRSFSWPHAAAHLAGRLDGLLALGTSARRRRTSGHHRLTAAWRGDLPHVAPHHRRAAEELLPHLVEAQRTAARSGRRLVVAIGGESGAGKTELAHCLHFALRRRRLWSALLPGDVFFRLPPADNHEARLRAEREGRLADHIGPPREVDIEGLDRVLASAADPRTGEVTCPSDCRALGRRYARVSLDLTRCQVLLVDLTYAMLLDGAALRIFLESDHMERRESVLRRNAARDPDQDPSFIRQVLALEQERIAASAGRAHLTVGRDGAVREARSPERVSLAPGG